MGNLVFQATLGGQVNLVGPNTASTYNLNVPTVNATLATTDANTFTAAQTISSGNLIFSGTGQKITGDYSNATLTSRAAFQTSTTNGSTGIYALPNGTSTAASWQATNAADPTNASKILIATNGSTDVQLVSGINGTGTYLPLTFYTNGAEKMRLDTSGNLGLGVTPSPNSLSVGLDLAGGAGLFGFSNQTELTCNAYYSAGAWRYKANAYANLYQMQSGQHQWNIAPSGTAGNAITFTQAMTLDASGVLYVGANQRAMLYQDVSGDAVVGGATGGTLKLFSTGSERARIDSSGNLLVGKTSTSDTVVGITLSPSGSVAQTNSASTNGTVVNAIYSTGASNYRFYVGMGGTVFATSTSISAISDQTLKTNVRDLETGLTEVMALKPRRFDWINGDASNVAGFIAQEVQQVLPELVTDYVYSKDEEGNDINKKSLKMGDILPTLVKAIQEQQAIITQLQSDVEALKAPK